MESPPEEPLLLEPPLDTTSRRRPVAVVVAVALAAVVAVVFAAMTSRADDSDDEAVPELFARAVQNTAGFERIAMELEQRTKSVDFSAELTVDRANMRAVADMNGRRIQQLAYDGVLYVLVGDSWWEYPAREASSLALHEQLRGTLDDLLDRDVVEEDRRDGVVVFGLTCDGSSSAPNSVIAEVCRDVPSAVITIAVDEALVELRSIRIEGEIAVYVDRWEHGYLEMRLTGEATDPVAAPERVDQRGVRCLASELGLAEATSRAINSAIQDKSTGELGELYERRCGFPMFPPGEDFGER